MSDHRDDGAVDTVTDDTSHAASEDRDTGSLDYAAELLADGDEADEVEADQEPETPEDDQPAAEEADAEEEADADPDDEPGKLRMADYTRKTQALSAEREAVAKQRDDYTRRSTALQTAFGRFQAFAESVIPPEPSLQLAQSDPAAYQYQTALRQQAIRELSGLFEVGDEIEQQAKGFSEAEIERYRSEETAKLVAAMPDLRDPVRKSAFDARIMETAKSFGFSEDEIAQTADHRMLRIVHFAAIGQRAEQNRKNAQRRQAEAPKKGTEGRAAPQRDRYSEDRRRLQRSGSIDDAARLLMD